MKKLTLKLFLFSGLAMIMLSSCTSIHKTMREPSSRVEFEKDDFALSGQVSAEAKTVKVLSIDWSRLSGRETAAIQGGPQGMVDIANIPVIGNYVVDKTANYALYNLMAANPGYDVVFYPQYETRVERPIIGIGFLYKTTTVKTTARLGKLTD
ncbi:MAG: hypothetical protein WD077_04210 [Bacteroidia bacterium]